MQSKLCVFTLWQAQRLATCRSGVISDSERQHGTLGEECVVATEAGSTKHVGALPSQQMFEMGGSVTLTPSDRSHRPSLAPLVEAVTSSCAIELDLATSQLLGLILRFHIMLFGSCADVLPNSVGPLPRCGYLCGHRTVWSNQKSSF